MLRTIALLLVATLSLSFHLQPDCAAAEPAFRITIDESYKRPILRSTPPQDKHGERPLDQIQRFLKAINDEDYDTAARCCLFGGEELGEGNTSIEGHDFRIFCKKVREHVESVTVSGSSIPSSSSSIFHSKGKYWNVWYKYKPASQDSDRGYFCLLQVDGIWRILEKPHWRRVVTGEAQAAHW